MEVPQLQKALPLFLVLGCAFGIVLLIGSASCSNQQKFEVLTFFFDGVPPVDSPEFKAGLAARPPAAQRAPSTLEANASRPAASASELEFAHKPFEENKCSDCHNMQLSMTISQDNSQLCKQCHQDFVQPFKYLHAPVRAFQCNLCHQAHSSRLPHLLSAAEESLCFSCHNEASVVKGRHHQNLDIQKCSSCHDPHGGDNRMLLKQGFSINEGPVAASRAGGT